MKKQISRVVILCLIMILSMETQVPFLPIGFMTAYAEPDPGKSTNMIPKTPWIDVRAFGAKGDGVTDSRVGIQAAVDNTSAGTVYLPAGTYILSSRTSEGSFILLHSNLTIIGDGPGNTIIKVGNSVGPYKYIFSNRSIPEGLNNITLSGLTIDSNIWNNPIANPLELASYPRISIAVFNGVEFRVANVEFANSSDVNTIDFNGPVNARCYISGCTFRNMGDDPNHVKHDHSAIYAHADRVVIAGNIFEGAAPGAPGARTAIETHGSSQVITGNVIRNYFKGMNITGISKEESSEIVVSGNNLSGVKHGIKFWSQVYKAHRKGYGLANVIASNNTIRIKQYDWEGTGISTQGILFDAHDNLSVRNINLTGNIIEFEPESASRAGTSESGGVIIYTSRNDNWYENLNILGNIILNAPCNGIKLSSPVRNVSILGNQIINAGSSSDSKISWGYRAGIFVSSRHVDGLLVSNNRILDNLAVTKMANGIFFISPSGGTFRNIKLTNNVVRVTGKDQSGFLHQIGLEASDSWTRPFVQMTVDSPWKKAMGVFHGGSRIYDVSDNRYYELPFDGNRWYSYSYGTSPPSSGLWSIGDKIWNTGNGDVIFWKCIKDGTPGRWQAITGIEK